MFHAGEITLVDIADAVGHHPDMVQLNEVYVQRHYARNVSRLLQLGEMVAAIRFLKESSLPVDN